MPSTAAPAEADNVALGPIPEKREHAWTPAIAATERLGAAPLIWNPFLNLGTSFTTEQRKEYNVEGLLPPHVESLDLQAARVLMQLREYDKPINKYLLMNEIAATSQTVFLKVVIDNIEELLPIIYTPTVGEGCQRYGRLFRHPLGMYVSAFAHKGNFEKVVRNWPSTQANIMVVTNGGRILGLGDLGTNGMGISVGKIGLYCAGGGFHPEYSIPACLDLGTDNKELREDPFYLGAKQPRIHGEQLLTIVGDFLEAMHRAFPDCVVQFEDFETEAAVAILERYRDKYLCFNDDIQGTAAVVVAGVINGLKVQKAQLKDARVLLYGAGSSATGVGHLIAKLLMMEGGLSKEEAYKAIYIMDSKGLITTTRGDKLPPHKQPFARSDTPDMKGLKDVIAHVKPHALIGLTGSGQAFFENDIKELCKYCDRPLVFPLSNPTSRSEITAEDAIKYSNGRCIFAAGSPFQPVEHGGEVHLISQANNVFVFPGIGFGASMAKAKRVTDEMLIAAAKALADTVTPQQLEKGSVYPAVKDLRAVTVKVAAAVLKVACDSNESRLRCAPTDLEQYIKDNMWSPEDNLLDV